MKLSLPPELDGWNIEYKRDIIPFNVGPGWRPDPTWTLTDAAGHEHRYDNPDDPWPTLHTVYGEKYWCDTCNDEHQDEWLACKICGERIKPSMFPTPPRREFIAGRTQVTARAPNGDLYILRSDEQEGLSADKTQALVQITRRLLARQPDQTFVGP